MTREVTVTVTRHLYELPDIEPLRKRKKRSSVDQAFMAKGWNSRHGGGRGGGGGRGRGGGGDNDGGRTNSGGGRVEEP